MNRTVTLLITVLVSVVLIDSASAMYDSNTGRFLQRDPLGVDPAGRQSNRFATLRQYGGGMSLYEMVGSSPVFRVDPLGLRGELTGIGWGDDLIIDAAEGCIQAIGEIGRGIGSAIGRGWDKIKPKCKWKDDSVPAWNYDGYYGMKLHDYKAAGIRPGVTPGSCKAGTITLTWWKRKSFDEPWNATVDGIPVGCKCMWSRFKARGKYCCKVRVKTKIIHEREETDGVKEKVSEEMVFGDRIIKWKCKCETDPDGNPRTAPPAIDKPPTIYWGM